MATPSSRPAPAVLNLNFVVQPVARPTPTPWPGIQWNNTCRRLISHATNWDPQMVPGTNDAIFGLASAYSVERGNSPTERLEIRNGDVTFTDPNYNVAATAFDPAGILLDNSDPDAQRGKRPQRRACINWRERSCTLRDVIAGGVSLLRQPAVGGPGNGILDVEGGGIVLRGEGRIGTGVGGGTVKISGTGSGWGSGNLAVHWRRWMLTIVMEVACSALWDLWVRGQIHRHRYDSGFRDRLRFLIPQPGR